MIDIHCHLLPNIDDGPDNIEQSLDLARQAVSGGITHAILTPHIHHGRWENTKETISAAAKEFRKALSEENIPLTIGFAAEIRIGIELLSMVPNQEIPFLGSWGNEKVLLLEMPHNRVLPGTDKIVSWLIERKIRPMIAHPERNKDVIRRLDKLNPLIELGCLFQVTAGSVSGQFGKLAQLRAEELLRMGVVTVLASDAHHVDRRPVNLADGRDAAASLIGEKEARKLVYDNPLKIVGEKFMVPSVDQELDHSKQKKYKPDRFK